MCTGVEIALMATSAAMSAGSMWAQSEAQAEREQKMKDAQNAYDAREADLQRRNQEVLSQSIGQASREGSDASLAGVRDDLTKTYEGVVPTAAPQEGLGTGGQGGNKIVKAEYDKQLQSSYQQGLANANRKAITDAWGKNQFLKDAFFKQRQMESQTLSDFARGWGPVLQSEMADAQKAGGDMDSLSMGLKFGGMLAGAGAGVAHGMAGAAPASTTPVVGDMTLPTWDYGTSGWENLAKTWDPVSGAKLPGI